VAVSAGAALAVAGAVLAVAAVALAAAGPYSPQGFAYKCVLPGGGVEAGYAGSPLVYYVFVHSVHKDLEVDVLEVAGEGFKPSLVYLRDFGAGTPEDVVGEEQGFIVARPAVAAAKPALEVSSRGNPTIIVGGGGAWLSIRSCAFIRLVPVAG